MNTRSLVETLEQALAALPVLDVHTHLVGGKLGARGLHDLLLYHMVVSDLYAAGCPSGARLTQYPGWPTPEEAHARIQEAWPCLPLIRNTSSSWAVRLILRDLYGWSAPITPDNWQRLDALIRERADDRAWQHSILDQLSIRRTVTEIARRGNGADDERLQYALEWGFFTRCQWGEFDTALYELERCWGRTPASPSPIGGGGRPPTERTIRTLPDVHDAVRHDVDAIPYGRVLSLATHISTDIDYRLVSDQEMEEALARELPNLSLAGYWWHNFFPDVIRQVIAERLDMLPLNKQIGFFSDAYGVEWTYGKVLLVRKQLAAVLADKITLGQYRFDDAIAIARAILFETPQTLLRLKPWPAARAWCVSGSGGGEANR